MKKVAQRQQSGGEAIAPLQSRTTGRIAHPPVTAPHFSHDFSRVPLRAKLKVGASGDAFEREADRVADEVMRTPEPVVQRSCGCGGSCGDCSQEDEPGAIRRKSTADVAVQDTEHAAEVLRSPGMPLDAETRASLEPRFGHDFSRVRVHTGTGAAQSAAALSARAYTVGHDIVFGAGEYRPQTGDGRRLLAHELTHVVQQNASAPTNHIQRTDWGPLGGSCCNESGGGEWALTGDGSWQSLRSGCTGIGTDCDGMTCGGGFYWIGNFSGGVCRTPRRDHPTFRNRRWTPTHAGSEARSPTFRGSSSGDVPPDYQYDAE